MKEAYDFLIKQFDFEDGEYLIAGVSGGPDSMALLNLLLKLRLKLIEKNKKINIVCAHVNHKVRLESEEEEVFVKEYCDKKKVIFDCYHIENYGDDNFHNEAREKRYVYFDALATKYKAKYIFTAHHGDDLMETILMRMVRGSTLKGYSGFNKIVKLDKYMIVRPLIYATKKEILTYDEENNIPYVLDKSNEKDVYTRNRYRKYILPVLKKEDENVHQKFYKFSKMLQEYNEYIDKIVADKIKKIYNNDTINILEFLKEEHLIRLNCIYYILENIYEDDLMLINDRHVNNLYNLLTSTRANAEICLPNNIMAIKEYDICRIVKNKIGNNDYEIEISDYVSLPNGMHIKRINEEESNSNYICRLDSKMVKLPLIIRNRHQGDLISVKGMKGHKKVSDIFIDAKIPMSKRDNWPVVVDSENKVIWLPGLKKSKFDKQKEEKYDIILKYY